MVPEWEERWDDPKQAEELIEGLKAIFPYDESGFFHIPGTGDSTIFLVALPGPTRDGYAMVRTDPNVRGFREVPMKKAFGFRCDRWLQMSEWDFVCFAKYAIEQARREDKEIRSSSNVIGSLQEGWWRNKGGRKVEAWNPELPKADVTLVTVVREPFTWDEARGIFSNPMHAGIGRHPREIDDASWVRAAANIMRSDGLEKWLVNMLFLLRAQLGEPKE